MEKKSTVRSNGNFNGNCERAKHVCQQVLPDYVHTCLSVYVSVGVSMSVFMII